MTTRRTKAAHQCEPILTDDGEQWTAVCPHLGVAACEKDWPEAKAKLRQTVASFIGFCQRKLRSKQ